MTALTVTQTEDPLRKGQGLCGPGSWGRFQVLGHQAGLPFSTNPRVSARRFESGKAADSHLKRNSAGNASQPTWSTAGSSART